ncbi:Crp/Fnr family transcriptional regulator [Photobacterium sp. ZSDE20]|uniref:Crp/Fnr family transcriptional regulator n=1 Tax=Photobacterium pectinilyticum TaxID=2906793 RepID=A0ABT1N9G6_9GAMM|nr:Crp/Fnr family transcriptional regulator [Photobacterium sp. ZSDE20]MCQ1059904.1 Crp/Fnr family transcriptional regulator [Photobacterium sp. ZSDE20]MDD1826093.1 Crp/Fnr family transcriptional regulator [Photobacterium sp. ZSDE20]
MKPISQYSLHSSTVSLNVSKREAVYISNTKASGFYHVDKGIIGLYQVADTGKESLLRLYGPGSFFGYRSLFTNQRYPATARAMENSEVKKFDVKSFESLQQLSSELAKTLAIEVCHELGDAEKRLVQFSAFNAKNRIIDTIHHFFSYYPQYPWTYREISEYSATDVTTVIRFCKSLKESGVLCKQHRKPHPLDLNKLDRYRQASKEIMK